MLKRIKEKSLLEKHIDNCDFAASSKGINNRSGSFDPILDVGKIRPPL
jgi:hypothetical protein